LEFNFALAKLFNWVNCQNTFSTDKQILFDERLEKNTRKNIWFSNTFADIFVKP